jgi:hypothetical protein
MELDFSLGGLLGAIVGTAAAAAVYGPLASRIERGLRARPRDLGDLGDKERFEQELTLMRHSLFTFDILLFGGIGYWVGDRIGS